VCCIAAGHGGNTAQTQGGVTDIVLYIAGESSEASFGVRITFPHSHAATSNVYLT
jgi:hypothetical protein